jgi:hypothetical protein
MELDAGHERQNGAGQKPRQTAQEKEKHRYAAGGIDVRQSRLFAAIDTATGEGITRQ